MKRNVQIMLALARWELKSQNFRLRGQYLLTDTRFLLVALWNGRAKDSREIFWQRELEQMMFHVLSLCGQKMRRKQQGRQAKIRYDRNRFLRIIFGHFPGKHSVAVASLLYSLEQFALNQPEHRILSF